MQTFCKNNYFKTRLIEWQLSVIKLLSYWLSEDMKRGTHVAYILNIAYSRIWSISRLKCKVCQKMSVTSLETRRQQLALKFAIACLKNPQHKHVFTQLKSTYYKLRNLKSFEVPFSHSDRYKFSPIPALIQLLNHHFEEKKVSYE